MVVISIIGWAALLPPCWRAVAPVVLQWATLRSKKNAEKKLAVTIFSFPPDKGNVGTAAYLDVFGSIHTVLTKLRKEVRCWRLLYGTVQERRQSFFSVLVFFVVGRRLCPHSLQVWGFYFYKVLG